MAGERLQVTEGAALGKQVAVDGEVVIGRTAGADGGLQDDPEVSRRHARVKRDADGQLLIEDLGSANGTFVNGERIAGSAPLTPGDTVKIGQTTFVLTDELGQVPQPTRLAVPEAATRLAAPVGGEALSVIAGNARGKRIEIRGEFLIGRSADEDSQLGDDREISRRHARIERDAEGRLRIEDLGSANGTWVNDERVEAPRRLSPGDRIRIGNTTLELVGPPEPGAVDGNATIAPGVPGAPPAFHGGEQLRVTEGNVVGKRFELGPEFLLGRLTGEDSTLGADRKISRRHARITRAPDRRLTIQDLGSANGTWVNGELVQGPRALAAGDTIRVGATTLEVTHPYDSQVTSAGALPSVGGITYRARWPILALVVAFVAVSVVFARDLPSVLSTNNDFVDPQDESVKAEDRLALAAGSEASPAIVALVRSPGGRIGSPRLDRRARRAGRRAERLQQDALDARERAQQTRAPADAARAQQLGADAEAAGQNAETAKSDAEDARSASAKQRVERVTSTLEADVAVDRALNYYETPDPAFVSKDERSTLVPAFLKAGADEEVVSERLIAELAKEPGVQLGGAGPADVDVGEQTEEDLASAESIALPLLFILSLFVFRGLVAALLPVFVGIVTVLGTFLALRLVNEVTQLSVFALNMVIGLGLGVAIDYSLFILSRYREELARMGPSPEPLRRTLQTAGRTVMFSSITVAVALLSLLVFPQRFLYSMGIGGAVCTLVAAATALIALPALLAVLGPRVNALAPKRWQVATERDQQEEESGFWYRLSRGVMRHPIPVATVTAALLIAMGIPFLDVKFTGLDSTALPKDSVPRLVDEAIERDFENSSTSPITLAVSAPRTARGQLADYARDVERIQNVDAVGDPKRLDDRTWQIDVIPTHRALDERSLDVVRDIRALDEPFPVAETGESVKFVDQQAGLAERLPLALGILSGATILVLFLMTGSVILPIKSVLMNVLGLSATLGVLVLIFQDGWLQGPLDFTSQGALNSTQPILLFVVAFGLSTDYGVFLLTRIKEVHDSGASNEEAVAVGLERTGRIVTAAALLFAVAMGAFATSGIVFVKLMGLGAVLAVLIDATIVRALLVPALMALLGERNWWAPGPLRRLHDRIGLSEG